MPTKSLLSTRNLWARQVFFLHEQSIYCVNLIPFNLGGGEEYILKPLYRKMVFDFFGFENPALAGNIIDVK